MIYRWALLSKIIGWNYKEYLEAAGLTGRSDSIEQKSNFLINLYL